MRGRKALGGGVRVGFSADWSRDKEINVGDQGIVGSTTSRGHGPLSRQFGAHWGVK